MRRRCSMTAEIKPIRTETDHKAALKEIEKLWDAKDGTPESDRLEVLATLVNAYEDEHHPIDPPDAIEAILFRLDQMGRTKKDLEPLIGGRGRVSEVIGRKRSLSIAMIRRLNEDLDIATDVLIKPTVLAVAHKLPIRHPVTASKAEKSVAASKLTQTKSVNETTGKKVASAASKILHDPKASKATKSVAASALTQKVKKK
jgi:HTH-type transcriptional regulator / antitoxin HigA